jgi:hypothetical protein
MQMHHDEACMKVWRCNHCRRYFPSLAAGHDHQALWTKLHAYDSEIDEHDTENADCWTVVTLARGDRLDYDGRSVDFVRGLDDGEFEYSAHGRTRLGNVSDIHVPPVDPQLVRAWSAALELGIRDDEVSFAAHDAGLCRRFHDRPERLAEERHAVACMIGLVNIAAVSRVSR